MSRLTTHIDLPSENRKQPPALCAPGQAFAKLLATLSKSFLEMQLGPLFSAD